MKAQNSTVKSPFDSFGRSQFRSQENEFRLLEEWYQIVSMRDFSNCNKDFATKYLALIAYFEAMSPCLLCSVCVNIA